MFVNTALVTVIFVAAKLADETNEDATKDEVVTPEEKRAVPDTSSVNPGAVVPIPRAPFIPVFPLTAKDSVKFVLVVLIPICLKNAVLVEASTPTLGTVVPIPTKLLPIT
jgi:hypothetical protein